MVTNNYRICNRCIMDSSDPEIEFDENGVCNHCKRRNELVKRKVFTGEVGIQKLEKIVGEIKRRGTGKEYDCLIGVSGGVDSTYVAYKVKEMGLRPLAVHIDNGWNSELGVKNIENACNKLNIELYTHVINWEEFKDLQLSFLKASTPDSEIPSDHAIFSLMYQMAEKIGVNYIIAGMNIRTESHLPSAWSQGHMDWKYIKGVHKKFGNVKLKTFPHMGFLKYVRYLLTIKWFDILNYIDYVKKDAMEILENELGWKYYGGKHYESIYTRFYQGYILPKKFGYDKRRTHFSSLICSGEMSREDALDQLKDETYPIQMQREDKSFVIKKLGLSEKEFEEIMNLPKKTYHDYPSYAYIYNSPAYKVAKVLYKTFKKS